MMYENFDLQNVIMPVNADKLNKFLTDSEYDPVKTHFLCDCFRKVFSINYQGPTNVRVISPNLKLWVGDKTQLWKKVMKEVKLKHFTGPFSHSPFDNFIQSPIGLVDKDHGKDTRLIFHLSYPRNGKNVSVNKKYTRGALSCELC